MQLRSDLIVQAISRTLTHTVMPALDAKDSGAREQLGIAIGLLQFLSLRMAREFSFDRHELAGLVELSKQLQAIGPDEDLAQLTKRAGDVIARAQALPSDLRAVAHELRAAIAADCEVLYGSSEEGVRARCTQVVLEHARGALAVERSWLEPVGFERGAEALPPLAELLPE